MDKILELLALECSVAQINDKRAPPMISHVGTGVAKPLDMTVLVALL